MPRHLRLGNGSQVQVLMWQTLDVLSYPPSPRAHISYGRELIPSLTVPREVFAQKHRVALPGPLRRSLGVFTTVASPQHPQALVFPALTVSGTCPAPLLFVPLTRQTHSLSTVGNALSLFFRWGD